MLHETPTARTVIGLAIEVHRTLGPGLLESVYRECLALELVGANVPFEQERPIDIDYKQTRIRNRLRLDFVIDQQLIVEIKSVDQLLPIHKSQVLTYLRLTGLPQVLLINFNVPRLADGVKSYLNSPPDPSNR